MKTAEANYKFLVMVAAAALAAAPVNAHAMSAKDFVKTAAIANKFEIDSSQLALKQSHNDGVRDFAQKMVDDHSKAGDDMQAAVSSAKTKMMPPKMLDAKHKSMMDKLKKLQGASFDKEYIKMQVNAHKEAVKLFGDYAKTGKDESIRDFASHTLPTLKEHKSDVMKLQQDYGHKVQAMK